MEDYIRGLLCGYLVVQTGLKSDSAKRRRMFAVLSDSRMDFYVTDPRPEFKAKIADAYIFKPGDTQVNYYAELHPRAPLYSLCLTTDKTTDVYIAESDREAKCWHDHLSERLEALSSIIRGTLLLRKELSTEQQLKRVVFKTKYRWKARYVELGRSSLRFCKPSEHRTKTMKEFTLTATSFVGEESIEYLKRLRVLASYSIPVVPTAQVSRQLDRAQRYAADTQRSTMNSYGISIASATKCDGVSVYYPFIVATGESFLLLAAATERSREEWITAIRMRIVSLKYRHNNPQESRNAKDLPKLQGSMDTMSKPGSNWRRRWVELDNGILRVKSNERNLGAVVETRIIPTCQVIPTLSKANAFVVSNLGSEIALAPAGLRESTKWMQIIAESAKGITHAQYRRAFDPDIQKLLRRSVVYALVVPPDEETGLVLEKVNQRVVVLSHHISLALNQEATKFSFPRLPFLWRRNHQPRHSTTKEPALSADLPLEEGHEAAEESHDGNLNANEGQRFPIPPGSVLVGVQYFGMLYDSFENMWHKILEKRPAGNGCGLDTQQPKQPMRLLFRAPIEKTGIGRVKYRAGDDWALARCRLANGTFSITCVRGEHELLALPLRFSLVELVSDENCPNCVKISCTIPNLFSPTDSSSSSGDSSGDAPTDSNRFVSVFLKVELDADLFVWFEFLSLEISVARDGLNFPLTPMSIDQAAKMIASWQKLRNELPSAAGYASDQQRAFRRCRTVGDRVHDIESDVLENEAAVLQSGEPEEFCGICDTTGADTTPGSSTTAKSPAIFPDTPKQSRIPPFGLYDEASRHLTDDEVYSFFQQIGARNGGHVGLAEATATMERLTSHLCLSSNAEKPRRSVGNLLGSDFCSAIHALIVAETATDRLPLSFEAFESLVKRIQHPDVLELVRRFARNEIHIM